MTTSPVACSIAVQIAAPLPLFWEWVSSLTSYWETAVCTYPRAPSTYQQLWLIAHHFQRRGIHRQSVTSWSGWLFAQRFARRRSGSGHPLGPYGHFSSDSYDLSEHEIEVLKLLANGATNREIANELFISLGTVKNHVSNILGRLGLRDRVQAALFARDHHLV